MLVSVIIINYNTFELTSKCIRSVYQYTKGASFEIILVDNASEECNVDLFKNEFPDAVLIKNEQNVGFAKGNNIGIKAAKGDVILLLNSDTELAEDAITACSLKLEELKEEVAVVTCKLTYANGDIQKQCNRFPSISRSMMELFRIHKLFSSEKRADVLMGAYFDNQSDKMPDWIWGAFFMFKREALNPLPNGILNEDYFMYCEDIRWCYDFRKQDKKCFYNSQAYIIHHVSQSSKDKAGKAKIILKNEMNFLAKTQGNLYMIAWGIMDGLNCLFSSTKFRKNYTVFASHIIVILQSLFSR